MGALIGNIRGMLFTTTILAAAMMNDDQARSRPTASRISLGFVPVHLTRPINLQVQLVRRDRLYKHTYDAWGHRESQCETDKEVIDQLSCTFIAPSLARTAGEQRQDGLTWTRKDGLAAKNASIAQLVSMPTLLTTFFPETQSVRLDVTSSLQQSSEQAHELRVPPQVIKWSRHLYIRARWSDLTEDKAANASSPSIRTVFRSAKSFVQRALVSDDAEVGWRYALPVTSFTLSSSACRPKVYVRVRSNGRIAYVQQQQQQQPEPEPEEQDDVQRFEVACLGYQDDAATLPPLRSSIDLINDFSTPPPSYEQAQRTQVLA